MITLQRIAVLSIVLLCGAQSPPPAAEWVRPAATRVREWQEDIDFLAAELPKRHKKAFFKCDKSAFDAAVTALRDGVPNLQDDEVAVGLMKLTAMLGDAHTSVLPFALKPQFHSFPLSFFIFSDGPVIMGARESQKDLIGCTLVKFAGVPIDEALRRVNVVWAHENEPTFQDHAPRLLPLAEISHAVGLIPSVDKVEVTVRNANGAERAVELTPIKPGERTVGAPTDPRTLPLSRRRGPRANWYDIIPDSKTLYFGYNTCADEPGQTVAALAARILADIDAKKIERVIVDLRGNSGGNSALLGPFMFGISSRPALKQPGSVIALIGRRTFSSAFMNAADLKQRCGAILIGTPTGQKPNAYGEVKSFVLPNSKIAVWYSTKFWQREPGDRPSLPPDVVVDMSSAEYLANKDPVLDAAIKYQPK